MKFLIALFLVIFSVFTFAAQPEHCSLPSKSGFGRAAAPKYFYNSESGQCETFIWGGVEMGSNANRFDSKELCEAECKV